MATWTLADIRKKVRQVTGRFSDEELSNTELDKIINQYYQLRFPAEVKLEAKHAYYEFLTTQNQSYYDIPKTLYTNYEPPVTANNLEMFWYQNPDTFESQNPRQYTLSTPTSWTGDGTTVTFTKTIVGFPIYPGSLTISDDIELFEDTSDTWTTSDVTLIGSGGGTATINYSTGVISVTFAVAPVNKKAIHLNYILFKAGRPESLLYYDNKFLLFPAPDQVYKIKMKSWKVVTALSSATDTPDLSEWGPCIAYGAALSIFSNKGETDAYAETTQLHKEQISIVLSRTEQDLLNTRAMPNF